MEPICHAMIKYFVVAGWSSGSSSGSSLPLSSCEYADFQFLYDEGVLWAACVGKPAREFLSNSGKPVAW